MRAALIALILMFGSQAGAGCGDLCDEGWLKTAPDAELQALLAAGADVMARTEEGYTPLHKAAIHGTPAKIKALLISDSHSQQSHGLTFIITSGKSTVITHGPIISFSYQKWKIVIMQTGRSRECSTMSWTPMASNQIKMDNQEQPIHFVITHCRHVLIKVVEK